jgi:arginyl-tRNA synthetase
MLAEPHLAVETSVFKSQRIVVDFSSPNTAKQMHVGHLRSTIIGDCIARVFEFLGADVLRLNHIGDWGTAFGMLITYLKAEHPQVLAGEEKTDLTHLVAWYKAAKAKFDEDELFKKNAQQQVVALQSGNADALKAWQIICEISRQNYQEIYDLLNVDIIERGESFYNPLLAATIEDLTQKGLVTTSEGAKCIFLEGFVNREGDPLPLMIQKSDGGYNYASTDMAAIKHRITEEKADRIAYLTDAGQGQHFAMIFKAAEQAGYLTNAKGGRVRVDHVPFGLVLGPDGKKFKTRSGDTEPLINLIYAAIDEAEKIIRTREPQLDDAEIKVRARVLGINAIKYADLVGNRINDYVFS